MLSEPTLSLAQDALRPRLERLIYQHGLISGAYLAGAMQSELTKIAKEEGADAVRRELEEVGATCSGRSKIIQCRTEKSMTIRSLDIFFPKYTKLTWGVKVSYVQRGNLLSALDVTATRTDRRL
jgi:hypothetical protein